MSSVTYSVGMQCEAVWAEDGKLYPAEVLSVFKRGAVELCRVKFLEYDDEAEVLASDLRPLAKPQRAPKQAGGKAASPSAAPSPRQPAPSASLSPSSAVKAQGSNTPKATAAKTPQAAAAPELDSELKRLQAELRAKQEEDEREKAAAVEEMKRLAEKSMMEGYARQVALSDLKAREDRLKHQLALLSKNFASFTATSASSTPQAAAEVHDVADLPRCIDGIKRLQVKYHRGENEAVLVSQLGLAVNPKIVGLKQFLVSHPQHFEVIVSDGGPSTKGKATVASVKLK